MASKEHGEGENLVLGDNEILRERIKWGKRGNFVDDLERWRDPKSIGRGEENITYHCKKPYHCKE